MKEIIIRDFNFDMQESDATTYARNKVITRILNAFSLLLPVGERFFIESIREYRDEVSPEMREQINLFIRQEGQHGKEHRKLNAMLNVNTKQVDEAALAILNKYGFDKEHALLVTICLERYTGLLGTVLPKLQKFVFPKKNEIAHMWIMHGKEELEHIPVGEKLYKEYVKTIPKYVEIGYMFISAYELTRITVSNYRKLK